MADKILLCLLVALLVTAATSTEDQVLQDGGTKTEHKKGSVDENAADGETVADDRSELKQLLGAVKHYLDAQIASDSTVSAADMERKSKATLKDLETRVNAYEDARTVYDPSTTVAEVARAESSGQGYWTDWIDIDPLSSFGDGQYEDCDRVHYEQDDARQCYLGCATPLAARYALVDANTSATWDDIENCVGNMGPERVDSCGFRCKDSEARFADKSRCDMAKCGTYGLGNGCVRCPDVRIQFFCMGTSRPPRTTCCPYSTACTNGARLSLRDMLARLGSDAARRDVIAGILHQVKNVLEPADDSEQ